jgi:hypothetical protein
MGKIILTYNDIYEINQLLEGKNLKYKLHLHDMCGSQSYTIEPLSSGAGEDHDEDMKETITQYFEQRGIQISFLENNLEFRIVS